MTLEEKRARLISQVNTYENRNDDLIIERLKEMHSEGIEGIHKVYEVEDTSLNDVVFITDLSEPVNGTYTVQIEKHTVFTVNKGGVYPSIKK